MKFKYIKVGVFPDEGWRIQWLAEGTDATEEFVIERSSGPEGPFEEIAVKDHTTAFHSDVDIPFRSLWNLVYYKIKIRDVGTGDILVESKPISTQDHGSLITNEIIRQYELSLYGANGHPGYHPVRFSCYKRTTKGTKCTYCTDDHTGEIIVDRCDVCMGTRYLEGWSNKVRFNGRWVEDLTKETQVNVTGEAEDLHRTFWTANYPVLEPGDVLAEKGNGNRWRVLRIQTREPNGILTSQTVSCKFIDREFIEAELKY